MSQMFRKFIREMATKSPDAISVWKQAKTAKQKEIAKKTIIQNARKKALLRDEVIGVLRQLTLANLKVVHKQVFDINMGQTLLMMTKERNENRKTKHPSAS